MPYAVGDWVDFQEECYEVRAVFGTQLRLESPAGTTCFADSSEVIPCRHGRGR